jgi:hydrogenase maturation protein HypF
MNNSRKTSNSTIQSLLLHIKGRVQGVGFRPYIYRLAKSFDLKGFVLNRTDGVIIHIEGTEQINNMFIEAIPQNLPPASMIKEITQDSVALKKFDDFQILPSRNADKLITEISPDIAVCKDCLEELYVSQNHRFHYPFINCTNCGPRFTLIEDFPYDRHNTTMLEFSMCSDCRTEYEKISCRRFHAQPVCCDLCGPVYKYHWHQQIITHFEDIIIQLGKHIDAGKVVAIKGLGGYNLACNAFDPKAVNELRQFKKREKKPFAVMFRSLRALEKIASINKHEAEWLNSWQRPIVVVDNYNKALIPQTVASNLNSLGIFLPYLPLHYLLFDSLATNAIVLTSGNESDIPILYKDESALKVFKGLSGGILTNNRRIARRIDDSVIRIINNNPCIYRRARGFVPSPVETGFDVDGILATGAELSNCFCIGKANQAILSQHIGDLQNAETFDFYTENISEFSRIYRFQPEIIACDLHPDYLSTRYAENTLLPLVRVQHHHAHVAAVMIEHQLNGPVIGLSYDGTGYGTDGNIWGSELLVADYKSFERISHFEYIPLPGGDKSVKEPWRTGLAYLYNAFGADWQKLPIPFIEKIDKKQALKLMEAIDKKINSPMCCSAGRLFDAVAAILVLCLKSDYHAQAPMMLEDLVDAKYTESYPYNFSQEISFAPTLRTIVDDIIAKKKLPYIVTKFHNTVAKVAFDQVVTAGNRFKIENVVLSGGTFQNKFLTEKLITLLQESFNVYFPLDVPCNDGGIALGQIAVASGKKAR